MSTRFQPDVEEIAIDYLLDIEEVTDIAEDRIFPDSPENVQAPYLKVLALSPRADNHHWVGTTRLQIDAYAEDRGEARDLCEAALVALLDMPQHHDAGVVSGVRDVQGTHRLPDPIANLQHFMAEVAITTHPGTAGS